ncbi:MAG: tRNA (uridine(34)/cytosine(34)/5-carboxymethylaminomethyluridine(34)-2'-O)-methyltransferase TrmL [Gallionellales bacterium RIFCSPLOWO2_02_60_31]|nr:MAG: tRNA (uridine(34)/cytosine(34)/5-carboxymethylaminomethyluridine(34)-2'-O)-methyltransferase TrmL [Gallionellales bacterium RIFCSPLOWO2_02_60_31]
MFHVILYQPEIPPNTGNIIRLCANTGCQLHLVKPLGFTLEDKQLVRAGLDYHEFATLRVHDSLELCLQSLPHPNPDGTASHSTRLPNNSSQVAGYPPEGEGTNVSLRELVVSRRVFALTTKGSQAFHQVFYQTGDAFLFGPESRGLPAEVLDQFDAGHRVRLPMLPHSRSLNLSNTVAVAVFEAWRQCGFDGGK